MRQSIFQRLAELRLLRPVSRIFHTLDGIVYGTVQTAPGAPHFRDHIEIKRYMSTVILAMVPSVLSAIVYYGWKAVAMIAVSYIAGGVVEVLFALIRKREIEEGFLVTGLIFPLIMPPTVPLWVVAVGIMFGVFFGKEVFGGTGRNIFNPALVGRLFVTIAFPQMMSSAWLAPFTDAVTAASPLAVYKLSGEIPPIRDLLLGLTAGSMGELFRAGIIAGGLLLMFTRVANWRVPVAYLGTVAAFAALGHAALPARIAPAHFQLLAGGLLFGAMYMATDPVSSPSTREGKLVFGCFCGILTVLIRTFSGYTEGVMFSIVFMNAFAPLIDHLVLRVKYRPVAAGGGERRA